MSEEIVEIPVTLDNETHRKLMAMTKKEIIEKAMATAVKAEVFELRCKTAMNGEADFRKEIKRLENEVSEYKRKLDISEMYVEQARSMIETIMDRWYSYDD